MKPQDTAESESESETSERFPRITAEDVLEFSRYLRQCTNAQVYGVYEKERDASRAMYAALAFLELERRGLPPP